MVQSNFVHAKFYVIFNILFLMKSDISDLKCEFSLFEVLNPIHQREEDSIPVNRQQVRFETLLKVDSIFHYLKGPYQQKRSR